MKIAIVTDAIYPYTIGGSEIRNYEIAKRLVRRGHEVHIYGAKIWKGESAVRKEGIITHGIYPIKSLYNRKGKRGVLDYVFLGFRVLEELGNENFDLIDCVAFNPFNCFACKYRSIKNKIPLILTWHQYFGRYYLGYFGKIKGIAAVVMERIVSKLSGNNIAVSEKTKEDLIEIGMRENIEVIENGVDLYFIDKIKTKGKKYDFVFVGRLNYQKNLELLVKSAGILKNEIKDFKICIVGDGKDKERLIYLVNELDLSENFVFLGEIKDRKRVFEIMKESKVFVLPSYLEGFPLVIVEANACGLPLIITNHKWNGAKSYVDNMKNGIIVGCDEESFAFAMKKLVLDDKLRERMSKYGTEKAKRYDWDEITKKVEEYYFDIIAKFKLNREALT